MKKIILDTNMLLVPGQFTVDIFSELERIIEEPYEIIILEETMKELRKIASEGKGNDQRAAKLGLLLLEQQQTKYRSTSESQCKDLKIIPGSGTYADDAILAIAEDDCFVATNDTALKHRLLDRGIRVVFLKQQQYLTVST